MASTADADLQLLAINTARTLAMDAVQAAESGHPGTPMALAPLAFALYAHHARHNPADPHWADRDRIVLSAGHASMLIYASLYLSGYDVSLDDIKNFRQWGSKTPGHPEVGHTPGVETTTGPLGQGLANAVGMAVAEKHLAAVFNREGHAIIDHYTWFIAGDGCLMEGISHEAASFAGHQQLGKLIGFFDDNRITIEGGTDLACSDDAGARFAAYGWQVLHIADVNDRAQIDRAIADAKADTVRPSLIVTRTHIGFGSPNRADTAKAHGEPLGKDEIALTKQALGWPSAEPFFVPDAALAEWRTARDTGARAQDAWRQQLIAYAKAHPDDAKELGRRLHGDLPAAWESALPSFDASNGNIASRNASGIVLNAVAPKIPELVGGSADLAGSNLTTLKGVAAFQAATPAGRNYHFGIREHAMGAVMNGMALHGGVIPYSGTFLVFSDYSRPAIRLGALMGIRVIHVMTHDSIGVGEDGPTHQPVEHVASLRAIPNLNVFRPADAVETAECWKLALESTKAPSVMALSRQKVPAVRTTVAGENLSARGAYQLAGAGHPAQVTIFACGSEIGVAMAARDLLEADGIGARVVSTPCWELFDAQPADYQAQVIGETDVRVAVDAGIKMGWERFIGENGAFIGMTSFGASAPADVLFKHFGITAEAVAAAAKAKL